METSRIQTIKKLALFALFSDDYLMDVLVLKGGNALNLVYDITTRSSIDLDFSLENDFPADELKKIKKRIGNALYSVYSHEGFTVFDLRIEIRPRRLPPELKDFWGGYRTSFKVIETNKYKSLKNNLRALRVSAADVGPKNRKIFQIDISKFEHCSTKKPFDIEGYTLYAYTPEMMVFEKLRAICQQMPEYAVIVKTSRQSARARDFFDICVIAGRFRLSLTSKSSLRLLTEIFKAKRVPLKLIGQIPKYREFHRQDFPSVASTLDAWASVESFDFYYDFVLEKCVKPLKSLWKE